MREIIFRAKTVCDGDWVYGGITWNPSKKEVFIHTEWDEGKVIPETVGQYTGLCDKNGTRIFEGDIVKVENALVRGIFAVEYCGISACFIVSHGERRYFLGGCNSEVIGNIHDNPELLKE